MLTIIAGKMFIQSTKYNKYTVISRYTHILSNCGTNKTVFVNIWWLLLRGGGGGTTHSCAHRVQAGRGWGGTISAGFFWYTVQVD